MITNAQPNLRDVLYKVINEYADVYSYVRDHEDWKNPFREYISKSIPELLLTNAGIEDPYIVEGSYGKGRWTGVPWIAVFDTRITTSAQKGVYIVYLLNKDTKELFLTFEVAATETRGERTDAQGRSIFSGVVKAYDQEAVSRLQAKVQEIRKTISDSYFLSDGNIRSGSDSYDAGAVFYKKYTLNALPDESVLISDLKRMLRIYGSYYDWINGAESRQEEHSRGMFDSWEIVDENTAIKRCDKSFFTYRGSGVPKSICWFFNAENMDLGETKIIKLICNGTQYQASVKNETTDRRRVRIFWSVELGNVFEVYNSSDAVATFRRIDDDKYEVSIRGGEMEMTIKEKLAAIKKYIAAKGFNYEGSLIENFYLSLKSKPFVILAGTSGTGKTRLVKLFAEAIGATSANGQYKMVSVRPDWSDSTDLFGHVDLQGNFIPGAIIDFVKKASTDLAHPYILCLDEMNLARVEYYLSDILSIIETRDFNGDSIVTDPLIPVSYYGADQMAAMSYGELGLPENLYIVGTVNMDETTFPFSKKVLDRANTIEFSFVDLMPQSMPEEEALAPIKAANDFLKTKYLLLAQCNESADAVGEFCSELQQINKILQRANAHVGYRVRDEIVFYLLNNAELDLLSVNDAMDNAIMQKILPRIQGSSGAVKDMLCELFKVCAGDYAGYQTEDNDISTKMLRAAQSSECKYKKSAEKIAFMVRRFEEDGFTSYWL